MAALIRLVGVLLLTVSPALATEDVCGDVNLDGFTNVVDALMIARGDPLRCPTCGNGVIEPGEECDDGELGGATCATFGFGSGELRCGLGCIHDRSGCYAERFEDNGDGTVTDNQTGLMWEKKTDDGSVHDKDNGYTWSDTFSDPDGTAFVDFLGALNHCVDDGTFPPTGVTGGFAGYCDWRLPTIVELQTIVDLSAPGCGSGSPCIDETVFGPTMSSVYWSSTTRVFIVPSEAWRVIFDSGVASNGGKIFGGFVRAVRGGR